MEPWNVAAIAQNRRDPRSNCSVFHHAVLGRLALRCHHLSTYQRRPTGSGEGGGGRCFECAERQDREGYCEEISRKGEVRRRDWPRASRYHVISCGSCCKNTVGGSDQAYHLLRSSPAVFPLQTPLSLHLTKSRKTLCQRCVIMDRGLSLISYGRLSWRNISSGKSRLSLPLVICAHSHTCE